MGRLRKREYTDADLKAILNSAIPWPEDLEPFTEYRRVHDDHDGTHSGSIAVTFTPDGDAHVSADAEPGSSLRYRTSFGGGASLRTRNALVILALAIKMDSGEAPK